MTVHDTDDILDDQEWFERLRSRRLDFVRSAAENNVNLDVFSKGYPDTAHLVYELLQNAEDAGASYACFRVNRQGMKFEHDGRPFTRQDVDSITTYGDSTKDVSDETIGQFGLGFKAVYVYTDTPLIWSRTFNFNISDKFVPDMISADPTLGDRTIFWLPFDSPKTPPNRAYNEIKDRLKTLSTITLLYLSHIRELRWSATDADDDTSFSECRLRRIVHPEAHRAHREVRRITNSNLTETSNFLCFTETAVMHQPKEIAIVFELQQRSNSRKQQSGDGKPEYATDLARRFKISPAERGNVAVYFSAVKEKSSLRFHIHAPFEPDAFRSSLKHTPENSSLLKQVASLAAQSLTKIRDLDLLDRNFLSALPNSHDDLPELYIPIRDAIIEEMKRESLTPKKYGGHAPASTLLQGEAKLKELLTSEDLNLLKDDDNISYDWAIDLGRDGAANQFLRNLEIERYGMDEFVETLRARCSDESRFDPVSHRYVTCPEPVILDWMDRKSIDWHRKLYALFCDHYDNQLTKLSRVYLVRCSDGEYRKGSDCYFELVDDDDDSKFPYADARIYTPDDTSDRDITLQAEHAHKFLKAIGVDKVKDEDRIRMILAKFYERSVEVPWDDHWAHVELFMKWFSDENRDPAIFDKRPIFVNSQNLLSDGKNIYINEPYYDTQLDMYYSVANHRSPLSERYLDYLQRSEKERCSVFIDFAKACGVIDRLEVEQTRCIYNPQWSYLVSAPGKRTGYSRDQDYVVRGLDRVLEEPTVEVVRLVWNMLMENASKPQVLEASYRNNASSGEHVAASQLVHHLKDAAWVPQTDETTKDGIRFVRAAEALSERLPSGFPYDPGWDWLNAIDFGWQSEAQRAQRSEMRERLSGSGMPGAYDMSDEEVERYLKFRQFPPEEQDRLLRIAEAESGSRRDNGERPDFDMPTSEPGDPDLRARRVRNEAHESPTRSSEMRERSVDLEYEECRKLAREDLRRWYTNDDDIMICQLCQDELPFRLPDGEYFFVSICFLEELAKVKSYRPNFLALCPNHAAMFQNAENPSVDQMMSRFLSMEDCTFEITLASQPLELYFIKTHIQDLRAVIEDYEELEQPE